MVTYKDIKRETNWRVYGRVDDKNLYVKGSRRLVGSTWGYGIGPVIVSAKIGAVESPEVVTVYGSTPTDAELDKAWAKSMDILLKEYFTI